MALEVTSYHIRVRREPYTEEEKAQQLARLKELNLDDRDRDYFNIWANQPEPWLRVVPQPVGINEIQTKANGERVIEIDTNRMEP